MEHVRTTAHGMFPMVSLTSYSAAASARQYVLGSGWMRLDCKVFNCSSFKQLKMFNILLDLCYLANAIELNKLFLLVWLDFLSLYIL